MAGRHQREFIVGLIALIALIALVVMTVQIREMPLFEGTYRINVRFQEVAGSLARGATVLVYGVKVGEATEIAIDPDPAGHPEHPVRLELRIRESVELYQNAQVEIAESAIIGETTVIISPGTPTEAKLADGATLIGTELPNFLGDIQEIAPEILIGIGESVTIVNDFLRDLNQEGRITEAVTDLAAIIDHIEGRFVSGEGDLTGALANIREFTDHLNQSLTLFDESMTDVRDQIRLLRGDVADAIETLHISSHDTLVQAGNMIDHLDQSAERLGELIETSAPQWERISGNLEETTGRLNSVLDGIESGEGSLGLLVKDEALYRELTELLIAANRWVGELDSILSGAEQPLQERVVPYDTAPRAEPPQ